MQAHVPTIVICQPPRRHCRSEGPRVMMTTSRQQSLMSLKLQITKHGAIWCSWEISSHPCTVWTWAICWLFVWSKVVGWNHQRKAYVLMKGICKSVSCIPMDQQGHSTGLHRKACAGCQSRAYSACSKYQQRQMAGTITCTKVTKTVCQIITSVYQYKGSSMYTFLVIFRKLVALSV